MTSSTTFPLPTAEQLAEPPAPAPVAEPIESVALLTAVEPGAATTVEGIIYDLPTLRLLDPQALLLQLICRSDRAHPNRAHEIAQTQLRAEGVLKIEEWAKEFENMGLNDMAGQIRELI